MAVRHALCHGPALRRRAFGWLRRGAGSLSAEDGQQQPAMKIVYRISEVSKWKLEPKSTVWTRLEPTRSCRFGSGEPTVFQANSKSQPMLWLVFSGLKKSLISTEGFLKL